MDKFNDLIKKIPFLAKLDLSDKRTRTSLLVIGAAIIGLCILVIVAINDFSNKEETIKRDKKEKVTMEVPPAEDLDASTLNADDVQQSRSQSRMGKASSRIKDMFEDYDEEKADKEEDKKKEEMKQSAQAAINQLNGMSSNRTQEILDQQRQKRNREMQQQYEEQQRMLAVVSDADRQSNELVRQAQQQNGLLPQQPQESTTEKASNPLPQTKVSVRRSGTMFHLDDSDSTSEGFSSLGNDYITEDTSHPFAATFKASEKITNGQRVAIRLLEDMLVDGTLIPKNTVLMANCQINERLEMSITSMKMGSRILNLNLVAYDTDGNRGLYCPNTVKSKTMKRIEQEGTNIAQSAIATQLTGGASQIFASAANIFTGARGEVTIGVNAGYIFYLMHQE